jgi:hypothetical protein
MTIDHPVRRALARVCSDDTMARIVDPVLADIRSEQRRPRWLGYVDLLRALAVHTVTSTPRVIARAASDNGYAMPRAGGIAIAVSLAAAILIVVLGHGGWTQRTGGVDAIAATFLLPGAIAMTLPAALLIAIPLVLTGRPPQARTRRHVLALAMIHIALMLALIGWIVPEANQAYRVRISGNPNMTRGLNETPFSTLQRQLDLLKLSGATTLAVRRAEVGYQQRLAMTVTALPISVIALAIAWSRAGRRRPLVAGFVAFAIYLLIDPPIQQAIYVEMLGVVSWPVMVLAWLPQLLLGVAALYCCRIVTTTIANP